MCGCNEWCGGEGQVRWGGGARSRGLGWMEVVVIVMDIAEIQGFHFQQLSEFHCFLNVVQVFLKRLLLKFSLFSFPTFFLYISLHFNVVDVENG